MDFNKQGDIVVLHLEGSLTTDNAEAFKAEFSNKVEQENANRCVVDLADLTLLDSTGLGALISSLKTMIGRDGDLRLANLHPKVRLVFDLTRTHKVFDIFDSVDEAVASYTAT